MIKESGHKKFFNDLTDVINKIASGDYSQSDELYKIVKNAKDPSELEGLIESIALLAVKVEGREYNLELLIKDLKQKKEQLEEDSKRRLVFTAIFFVVAIGLSGYAFAFRLMKDFMDNIHNSERLLANINYGLAFFLTAIMIVGIRYTGRPMAEFGLTLKDWKKGILYGTLYSLPWLALATLLKWYMVGTHPDFLGKPVINFYQESWTTYPVYFIVLSFQEFFARGMLQGPMEYCLAGKNKKWLAITLASLMFGVYHLHYSILMATVSIITGLQFGYVYSRHRTLVAPITTHMLVGFWGLGPLGFMNYFLFA